MLAIFVQAASLDAVEDDDRYSTWFFTSEEVTAAYQYQQNYGERLRDPLRASACLFRGSGEFATSYRRNPLAVSCRFVLEVTRHLKEMLDAGAAKYLFPLDADHGHLGVPLEVWNSKYKNLPVDQVFPAILREPGLVALYRGRAFAGDRSQNRRGQRRGQGTAGETQCVGYFDGRPIKILSPDSKGAGVAMPENYYSYGGFNSLASPCGELYLSAGANMITFDIAFDSNAFDGAEEQHAFSGDAAWLPAGK